MLDHNCTRLRLAAKHETHHPVEMILPFKSLQRRGKMNQSITVHAFPADDAYAFQ